jgi:hypothetical protein
VSIDYEDEDFMEPEPRGRKESAEEVLSRKAEQLDLAKITRKIIEERIAKSVDEAIGGRIESEVSAIFEDGWTATNRWGEPENHGKAVNIRDRISAHLCEKDDRYGRDPMVNRVIQTEVKRAVEYITKEEQAEFRKELKDWKATKMADKLRAVLDGDIFR